MTSEERLNQLQEEIPHTKGGASCHIYLNDEDTNLNDIALQEFLMNNWWDTDVGDACNIKGEDKLDMSRFYTKISWQKLIPIRNLSYLQISKSELHRFEKQKISWFHFAIMAHWTFLWNSSPHIKNLKIALSLENTLGQNAWHILALHLGYANRHNYAEMIQYINFHTNMFIMKKDRSGKTCLDILENNIKGFKSSSPKNILEINHGAHAMLKKIALYQQINRELQQEVVGKIKLAKI